MIKLSFDIRDKKIMTVVLGAAGVVIFALYLYFILTPQIGSAMKLDAETSQLLLKVTIAEKNIGSKDMLRKQIESGRENIARYEKKLPREESTPKLLQDLSDMANASGVKILEITPAKADKEDVAGQVYRERSILINARSGYHELGKFLSDMENAERFTKVTDINIKSSATQKRHDIELLVMTYELVWKK